MFNTSKDPNAIEDYQFNWAARLNTGETISASTWSEPTGGISIDDDAHGNTTSTVRLSGGTARQTYTVTNHVVLTPSTRELDHSLRVYIEEE